MAEDYVPGATEEGYDYTADDRVAATAVLGSSTNSVGDDEGFIATALRPDVKLEEIEKGSFRFLGPGDHVVYMKDIQWADGGNPVSEKVYVKQTNGTVRPFPMDCRKCKVIFAIPGDENLTCSDMFLLPPVPNQMEAYEYGYKNLEDAEKNPREKGGFHSKKFKHFLGRLGFECDSNGKVPVSATKFANWKKYPSTNIHRMIKLSIRKGKEGGTYVDKKTGETKQSQGFNNIVMFSYCYVEPPAEVKVAQLHARTVAQQANAPAPVVQETPPAQEEEKPVTKSKGKKVAAQA